MCGRVGAAAIVVALVVVGGAADARARSETLAAPRDVGELPRASFDWVPGSGVTNHPTGELLLDERDNPRRVEAFDLRGRRVWASVLVGKERFVGATTSGDLVVIATDRRVSALEKRTGRRWWVWTPARGSVVGEVQARDGTFIVREDLPPTAEGLGDHRALVLLDARAGRARWRSTCPVRWCFLAENAGDELLVDLGVGFLRLDPATGTLAPKVELRGKIVAAGGDAVLRSWEPETAAGQDGPIELDAHSASRGQLLWKVVLNRGNHLTVEVRRVGDAWVVLSPGRVDVLDAATGATRKTVQLPDVVEFGDLAVLPDGRLVARVSTTHDRNTALSFVLVVEPAGERTVSYWSLPDNLAEGSFDARSADPLFVDRWAGAGVLRPTPLPAPRASRSLADEVKERVDRLLKGPAGLDLRILRRLDRSAYEAAVIARMEGATPFQLASLTQLLAPPPATAAARDALSRALDHTLSELPRAAPTGLYELFDAALSLLEAWPGKLPEGPMRKLGSALGTSLRDPTARREWAAHAAGRYFDLLWRAPYPDLDGPLRAAIAAVGRTTRGRADCPPAKRALSEDDEIWADLVWPVMGLSTDRDTTTLLEVPSQEAACIDISTLGAPVIVGSIETLDAIKAGKPRLAIHAISSFPLTPEGKAALDRLDPTQRAVLGHAPVREAAWSHHIAPLNAGGRRALIARVAGRWRIVSLVFRWVS